jgi:uncharacterized protein YndB with AHSA1/START domain
MTTDTIARSVSHGTFTVERTYPASPARVFAAWADKKAKAAWFPAGGQNPSYEFDFRVGGREYSTGGVPGGGPQFIYDAVYQDIVPDNRIIYSYVMYIDGTRMSVSVATVELKPAGKGTKLVFTEQGAFLDGMDDASQRAMGTEQLLDALGSHLGV